MNERDTENLVRAHFRNDPHERLIVEEQRSASETLTDALRGASKQAGGKGSGHPEFLVSAPDAPNLVVVVECKADPRLHESRNGDDPAGYAVDGVLHYAQHLARVKDVVAVAVSGTTVETMRVTTFRQRHGDAEPTPLQDRSGRPVERLLQFQDYANLVHLDPERRQREHKALLDSSKKLHQFLYSKVGVTEEQKPLLVSACLIALTSEPFRRDYERYPAEQLRGHLMHTVEAMLEQANLPEKKRQAMMQSFRFIEFHLELGQPMSERDPDSALKHILTTIKDDVLPYLRQYGDVDVLGQFYGEFLRYTAGDGKGLGIVLTPRHITELFADLAEVTPDSTVLDPCAGTGGFLISAMVQMLGAAGGDKAREERIKAQGLIGIEKQPHMFALAASNMILRGDGKSNLYLGSSLDPATQAEARGDGHTNHPQPTVGMINPPYAMKNPGHSELHFIEAMLNMLAPGSTGIAIVPISVGIKPSAVKADILKNHTLIAAMSMPDELFYPVGTVTSIFVFKAHQPHSTDRETWFGYWKNDGFVKTKDKGRVDLEQRWDGIRSEWLNDYRNRRVVPGRSVLASVGPDDEWCAEAYLETDYSTLTEEDFKKVLLDYALFSLQHGRHGAA